MALPGRRADGAEIWVLQAAGSNPAAPTIERLVSRLGLAYQNKRRNRRFPFGEALFESALNRRLQPFRILADDR
jgi:hypothetical protein